MTLTVTTIRRRPTARLENQRIVLRPLREEDLGPTYLGWLRDPEVTRYMQAGSAPATSRRLRQYVERFRRSRTDFIFAIVDRATGLHIGNVTVNHLHPVYRTADTGLMIGRKDFWGQGYATEAWSLLLDHAFRRLGVRKVVAGAAADHEASVAVLRKLGFREEGRLRREVLMDGRYQDVIRFGLFAEELVIAHR